jgi:tetratricopeptide (TPR) repeat protein
MSTGSAVKVRLRLRHFILPLALLALLPYGNTITTGFTFDDEPDIRNNTAVTAGIDPLQILATPIFPGDLYRPFTVLTFAINERLAPGAPAPFHAVNVVLHAAVTIFVFATARRVFKRTRVAVIAAALFAVHPVHTEAVTSIVGRAELLVALFGLITLLSAASADQPRPPLHAAALRALSLTSFFLALLSKENAATILPLLMLFRIALRRDALVSGLRREIRSLDWLPYALCIAVFLLLRSHVIEKIGPTPLDNPLAFVPVIVRIRSALAVLWDYFGLLLVPLALAADYSYNQVAIANTWLAPRFLGGLTLTLIALAVALRHRHAAVRFAAAFPFIALAATSNLIFPIGTIKGERLLYLPSVGAVLLAAYLADRGWRSPRYHTLTVTLLACTIAAFAARTWARNWDWEDNATLYASMVRAAPNSAKARYNFGGALIRQGRYDAAMEQFGRALDAAPWAEGAALGMGIAYEKTGHPGPAVGWYRKALEITPEFSKAHNNLCRLLLTMGDFDAAVTACRRGLRHNPADTNLLEGLGASLVGSGDVEKGLAVMRRALALKGHDERLQAAIAQMEAAAHQNPTSTGRLE